MFPLNGRLVVNVSAESLLCRWFSPVLENATYLHHCLNPLGKKLNKWHMT